MNHLPTSSSVPACKLLPKATREPIRSRALAAPARLALACGLLVVTGWGIGGCNRADEGRKVSEASPAGGAPPAGHGMSGSLPEGHPPIDGGPAAAGSVTDPGSLPLKAEGSGSLAELTRARAGTQNQEAAQIFADGFRLTFTSDQAGRDYPKARDLFRKALTLDPKFAEAYRGLAYAEFNIGFNREAAFQNYHQAIELKPDYGEAHYALAFMHAMDDVEKGAVHFKRAMELGVEDERNLGQRFYPQVKIDTH